MVPGKNSWLRESWMRAPDCTWNSEMVTPPCECRDNVTTLQRYNFKTLQHYNVTALQRYSVTALQRYTHPMTSHRVFGTAGNELTLVVDAGNTRFEVLISK